MRIGISGHQNIPHDALAFIEHGIQTGIRRASTALSGIASLAGGADQLFATAVLKKGGELHVIVPCRHYEESFEKSADLQSYLRLIQQASTVQILDHAEPSEQAYLDAGRHVVRASDLLLAVWDGQPAKGMGGTADIVAYARQIGVPVEIIWPVGVLR